MSPKKLKPGMLANKRLAVRNYQREDISALAKIFDKSISEIVDEMLCAGLTATCVLDLSKADQLRVNRMAQRYTLESRESRG